MSADLKCDTSTRSNEDGGGAGAAGAAGLAVRVAGGAAVGGTIPVLGSEIVDACGIVRGG